MWGLWFLSYCLVLVLGAIPDTHALRRRRIPEQHAGVSAAPGDTELVAAFVLFRHGDRTPDPSELATYPNAQFAPEIFFPFGTGALTSTGKRRAFLVGQFLRKRYDGFISQLYLPEEIIVRTTDLARTKMTAQAALAALYPPSPQQRWSPTINWQPIPYDYVPYHDDDLVYWEDTNCPRYNQVRDQLYERPDVAAEIQKYEELFKYLSDHTGTNVNTTNQVLSLESLFDGLNNVGIKTPLWAQKVRAELREASILEYEIDYKTDELIRFTTGVLLNEIIHLMEAKIAGNKDLPKMFLYSAHDNNVAGLLAGARVFTPHHPKYGSAVALELRRNNGTGEYFVAVVYSPEAGGPAVELAVDGCGGGTLCSYNSFVGLTRAVVSTYDEYRKACVAA
ncbi:venom acid phosphatase Acph-1 [Plutella xylostella]|uniref:venom acid phosphatase Acph-1 n=1 Tax=Plutella xylostella TaxID=51655 RepID=UPI00203315AB|nr:venom acid phosphatase Acph-1 [Plutella xylostella]